MIPSSRRPRSRTKGRWGDMPYVAERAPAGWKATHPESAPGHDDLGYARLPDAEDEVDVGTGKHAWARLLAKVYEGCAADLLTCTPSAKSRIRAKG